MEGQLQRLHYPTASLIGDYARAAFGGAVTGAPLIAFDLAEPVRLVFIAMLGLFAWFAGRTLWRQLSWIELTQDAIALGGVRSRRLRWSELRRLKLAYYAPRRTQSDGWLQLTLSGAGRPAIRLDSTLDGFDLVLDRARHAAEAGELPIDATTAANLAALGSGDRTGASAERLTVASLFGRTFDR